MIDLMLMDKAKKKSEAIETIDSSWRSYVNNIKDNTFTIPFKGIYNALIEDNSVLVEGYCGLLLIDKLYCSHKTYLLKTPVRHHPFRIYGVYDSIGRFDCFIARPEIGFHYLGMKNHGHPICTGDIEYLNPVSLELLREASSKIINSFRLINMESLGTVLLPDDSAKLKSIFLNTDGNEETKLGKLLNDELIEQIL